MSFKARLITFISVAVTLMMGVVFAITYYSFIISEERFSEEAIRGKSVLWEKVVQVQLAQMNAATSSMTRASDVLKALAKNDYPVLKEAALPTFNRLTANNVISRLQIADKSGSIVFSAPHQFSGSTSKSLVNKSLTEKKVFTGIERDDDGVVHAEVVFPLYFRGKLVGAAVYMISMEHVLNNFKEADGSEIHLFTDNGKMEFSTNNEHFSQIQHELTYSQLNLQFKHENGGRLMSHVQLPLLDVSGNLIANTLSATDYTESFTKQDNVYLGGVIAGLLVFGAGILLILWFIQYSFKPMSRCLSIIENISGGKLTDDIEITSSDEFGRILSGLKEMQIKLKSMIIDINSATQQLESSAEHLEQVTSETGTRVATQSRITQQLVENIDQLMMASTNVTESSTEASSETQKADSEVRNGRSIITDGVKTIQNISDEVNRAESVVQNVQSGTERIGTVLDVIKGIAEQTNLLALNAAIEAARAGEQGRGFAVVADEVRTLASRTQESTQEIETMIDNLQVGARDAVAKMGSSINMVSKGVEIVNRADESFNTIANSMSSISQKSSSISSAAADQMSLSQTMQGNVQTISEATVHAVEGNQTTAASTEELIQLAEKLKQKVSQFTI